jgi:hypothetical protein
LLPYEFLKPPSVGNVPTRVITIFPSTIFTVRRTKKTSNDAVQAVAYLAGLFGWVPFTLQNDALALLDAGFYEEAIRWRDWLARTVAGSPNQIQVLYGVAGERLIMEWEVPWLSGYFGASPVRIGNAAIAHWISLVNSEMPCTTRAALKKVTGTLTLTCRSRF